MARGGVGPFEGNLTADVAPGANVSDASDLEGALDLLSGHNRLEKLRVKLHGWKVEKHGPSCYIWRKNIFGYICPRCCDYDITL